METILKRITIDSDICHGKPCVRNLRYPVESILELLSAGMSIEDILEDYEDLEKEDILAVLKYASHLSRIKSIHKLFLAYFLVIFFLYTHPNNIFPLLH